MSTRTFDVVVAYETGTGAIGSNGKLPWDLPEDMKRFREITSQVASPELMNVVMLGTTTFNGLPPKFRPLPKRINVVISRTARERKEGDHPNLYYVTSFEDGLALVDRLTNVNKIFVIGGGQIYRLAMQHPRLGTVYATEVDTPAPVQEVDATFPIEALKELTIIQSTENKKSTDYVYRFLDYQRQ